MYGKVYMWVDPLVCMEGLNIHVHVYVHELTLAREVRLEDMHAWLGHDIIQSVHRLATRVIPKHM